MLVLSRQRDETIMIGDDIEVTVVDIRGDKVRLGINAPKEIRVHRKEVYEAIRRENRAAAQVKPEDLSGLGKIGPKGPGKGREEVIDCHFRLWIWISSIQIQDFRIQDPSKAT